MSAWYARNRLPFVLAQWERFEARVFLTFLALRRIGLAHYPTLHAFLMTLTTIFSPLDRPKAE